jgi:hypothetical protein
LHADDPFGPGPFDSFDHTIIAATGDDEAIAEILHSLMVEGEASDGANRSHGAGHPRIRIEVDRVRSLSMFGSIEVLDQGAAADDVEHLQSPADGEHGLALIENGPYHGSFDHIVTGMDAIEVFGGGFSSVQRRIDVSAPVQDDTVATRDEVGDIVDEIGDRGQDDRNSASAHQRRLVAVAGAESRCAQAASFGDLSSDDEDQRTDMGRL